MSSTELLREIEALPEKERLWLMEELFKITGNEQADWSMFSAAQLAACYGPKDSIYDEE